MCGKCDKLIWNKDRCEHIRYYSKGHYGYKFNKGHKILTRFGKDSPHWNGGIMIIDSYRYIKRPEHPFTTKAGYVLEHHLVWEEDNQAILLPWSAVHHIDHNKQNNHISNLQAMMKYQHDRISAIEKGLGRYDRKNSRRILTQEI